MFYFAHCKPIPYFQIKHKQKKVLDILAVKKFSVDVQDIAVSPEMKQKMREVADNQLALPPQICISGVYCGVSLFFVFVKPDGNVNDI